MCIDSRREEHRIGNGSHVTSIVHVFSGVSRGGAQGAGAPPLA